MPLKRIPDEDRWHPPKVCTDPDHNPPDMIVLPPGRYRHTCLTCGKVVEFVVPEGPRMREPELSVSVRALPDDIPEIRKQTVTERPSRPSTQRSP